MTKKATTKTNVAKTATTVANKATEQMKRPTIKSLQQEVTNLTEQLLYANKLALSLEESCNYFREDARAYEATISYREAKIKELENRSIAAQILFKLSQSFK
jgi:translation initiation factor 2B subunit (eIF-2B alpha/beta/delta family)